MAELARRDIASANSKRKPEFATLFIFAIITLCIAAPIGYLFFGSFRTDAPGAPGAGFTFANWIALFGQERYRSALINTVALCATTAVLSVLVGGAIAWILARTDAPGRRSLAVLMVVPLMISNLITALAWIALASPNAGFLNIMLRSLFGVQSAVKSIRSAELRSCSCCITRRSPS